MSDLNAVSLLRENLQAISPKDEVKWRTQRALLDLAERQEEQTVKMDRITQDLRELRTMVERVVHR